MEDVILLEKSVRSNIQKLRESARQKIKATKERLTHHQQLLEDLPDVRRTIHRRRELMRLIQKMQQEIEDFESGSMEHQLCMRSRRFLTSIEHKHSEEGDEVRPPREMKASDDRDTYSNNPLNANKRNQRIRKTVFTGDRRSSEPSIVNEFENHKNKASRSVYVLPYYKCQACDIHMHKLIDASVMVCPQCGIVSKYLDSSSKGLGYNDDLEFVSVSYKRQNHFQEWLNAFQGRETSPIPQDIIDSIMAVLYDSGVRKKEDITRDMIRQILKRKKLKRYKKHVTSIMSAITGKKPERLTAKEEEMFKIMFNSIQKPFDKHRPKNRKNFLSYSYVLFKFCELLGKDNFLQFFSLLKGRDKLYKQDRIWQNICADLEWEFIPSI